MSDQTQEAMREEFEKWFYISPSRFIYGWNDVELLIAREAWQAAIAQSAEKIARLEAELKDACEASYMRGRQHLMNELLLADKEAPLHENIRDMLPTMLKSGFKCPLCGKDVPHEHSPLEIIIYRNGVKYGRFIESPLPPSPEQKG